MHRSRLILRRTFLTLALGLMLAAPASAALLNQQNPRPGITSAIGMARDNTGGLWVSDHLGGVCRVLEPAPAIDAGLVPSPYCDPTGLLPNTDANGKPTRPIGPGQLAYDPSTNMLFAADGTSKGGYIWRFRFVDDPDSTFQMLDPVMGSGHTEIIAEDVNDRFFGLALRDGSGGGGSALHFSRKTGAGPTNIDEIVDPETCTAPCTVTGFASGPAAATSLMHVGPDLYVADGISPLWWVDDGTSTAVPVPQLEARGIASALAYDPNPSVGPARLYVGTTNPGATSIDRVDVLTPTDGNVSPDYVEGLSAVTAIAVAPDGDLDIVDDLCVKTTCEDGAGTANHYTVPFDLLGPKPTLDGPPSVTGASSVTFQFSYPVITTFYCTFDNAGPFECGVGKTGSATYANLAEGPHTFMVRAAITNNANLGPLVQRTFRVDRSKPKVAISAVAVSGTSADVLFSADKSSVDFACSLDGAAFAPCSSPKRFTGLAIGQHTVTVRGTDFLGNTGEASAPFTVLAPIVATGGKVLPTRAVLRGRVIEVTYSAPKGHGRIRLVIRSSVKGVPVVTTAVQRSKPGTRNAVSFFLPPKVAQRLRAAGKLSVTVLTGSTDKALKKYQTAKVTIVPLAISKKKSS